MPLDSPLSGINASQVEREFMCAFSTTSLFVFLVQVGSIGDKS